MPNPAYYAYYADQSDPTQNPQFRRRWTEPLDLLSAPCRLDRIADLEASQGHYRAAEMLARKAEVLRERGDWS